MITSQLRTRCEINTQLETVYVTVDDSFISFSCCVCVLCWARIKLLRHKRTAEGFELTMVWYKVSDNILDYTVTRLTP